MIEPIVRKKLELKYYLDIYQKCDDFPTSNDILFEITNDDEALKEKEMTLKEIIYILSFKIDNEKITALLDELIKQKYILVIQKTKKCYYKLIDHYWK